MTKPRTAAIKPDAKSSAKSIKPAIYEAINIIAVLLFSCALSVLSLYFSALTYGANKSNLFSSYFKNPNIVFLNWLPVFAISLIVYFTVRRAWITFLVSGVLTLLPTWVNYYKMLFRADPFMAIDVSLITEAAEMEKSYKVVLTWQIVVTIIAVIAIAVAVFFLPRPVRSPIWLRVTIPVILAVLFVCFVPKLYYQNGFYNKTENITEHNASFLHKWSDTDQYMSRGFIYSFIRSIKNARDTAPEGYNKDEAAAELAKYTYDDIPDDEKVNIIAIMLEAYNDLSAIGNIEFTNDPYKYFHQIQSEGYSGTLVTNTFGAGTINAERTFLTGYSDAYTIRSKTPSYVYYFKEQGYTVEGCHPSYEWFYNRRNVNEYLGFDYYYFFEDRYTTANGNIMSDKPFLADIIELFEENKETGKPYFNFSVTYQNHGPYNDKKLYYTTEYAANTGFSESSYIMLNNYLGGIAKTDAALREFFEYFRASDDPTIIILFGDHNPWMGNDYAVYKEAGINLNLDTDEGFYNYYSTPYVIWANDAAKSALGSEIKGDGGSISPMFLMNRLFDLCGWGGNEYMKVTSELSRKIDIINTSGVYREDGVLTKTLSDEGEEMLTRFKCIEYYVRKNG
ncbi:MAG: LTA synthase family protein [Eubacteriales bacterium]|jgi:phosphoglycerol transferase MdoB-like AlkP superfamily enzyme